MGSGIGIGSSYREVGWAEPVKSTNPDPKNFSIKKSFALNEFVMLLVNYPDCTTFEGDKILVFKGISLERLETQLEMDPHFTDDSIYPSPVMRLAASTTGWAMGKRLINLLVMSERG